MRTLSLTSLALAVSLGPSIGAQAPAASASADPHATVTRYCATCHSERTKAGGLALDKMDWDNIPAGAAVWEKSLKKLRVGMMPPPAAPQPEASARTSLITDRKRTRLNSSQ